MTKLVPNYYLRRKIKEAGYRHRIMNKTLSMDAYQIEQIQQSKYGKYLQMMLKQNYNIQIELT